MQHQRGRGLEVLTKGSYTELCTASVDISALECAGLLAWMAAAGTVFAPGTNEAFCGLGLNPEWSRKTGSLASIWP